MVTELVFLFSLIYYFFIEKNFFHWKFCVNVSGQRKNHTETIEKLLKDVENQSANSDHLQQQNKVDVFKNTSPVYMTMMSLHVTQLLAKHQGEDWQLHLIKQYLSIKGRKAQHWKNRATLYWADEIRLEQTERNFLNRKQSSSWNILREGHWLGWE